LVSWENMLHMRSDALLCFSCLWDVCSIELIRFMLVSLSLL
jgi:hypothetical protein